MSAVLQTHPMAHEMAFREMTLQDLDAVMRIEPTIYSHPWTRGNFSDSLSAGYPAYVLQQRNEMVGYAVMMMVLDEAHLLNISIAKAYQKQGLGRRLLEHMIHIAQSKGAANMFLEVRVSNRAAISLYEAVGFNEMSIRRGYYPAHHSSNQGREDAVLMGLAL